MGILDTLTTDVANLTAVDASAITLINGLAAEIKAAGTDPVALKALTDEMEARTGELAAAVAANPLPGTSGASTGASGTSSTSTGS